MKKSKITVAQSVRAQNTLKGSICLLLYLRISKIE